MELNETSTVDDIIASPEFLSKVDIMLTDMRKKRNLRPAPPEGFKYKKDEIDKMIYADIFNCDYFQKEIGLIIEKKSNLASNRRRIINYVCSNVIDSVVQLIYDKIESDKIKVPVEIVKKPRKNAKKQERPTSKID